MADFEIAYKITHGHERGYVNDPDDPGGETYDGVSRRANATWEGWSIIDSVKDENGEPVFNKIVVEALRLRVKNLFKREYWNPCKCSSLTQELANEMFDNAVNLGVGKASEMLQEALNLTNRNQKDYSDIKVDGKIGKNTLKALHYHTSKRGDDLLFKIINGLQCEHYIELMRRSPKKEKYIGWFNRVEFSKN